MSEAGEGKMEEVRRHARESKRKRKRRNAAGQIWSPALDFAVFEFRLQLPEAGRRVSSISAPGGASEVRELYPAFAKPLTTLR